jgi:hypothetical protein
MSTKVYLVGDELSPKTNQWLSMTNNWIEAERLKAELGPKATHKVVEVKERRGKR